MWIETYTGRKFWPLAPRAEDVCIEDIAHALSQKCRFTGHTRTFYSVAQHSVIVSWHCSDENALWGLLHDAAEAYLPDVARPIKPYLDGFREIEDRVLQAVAERFGLPWPMPFEIAEVDLRVLAAERRDVMGPSGHEWELLCGVEPADECIWEWLPHEAEATFIHAFKEIGRAI